jgi:hypothetical protein
MRTDDGRKAYEKPLKPQREELYPDCQKKGRDKEGKKLVNQLDCKTSTDRCKKFTTNKKQQLEKETSSKSGILYENTSPSKSGGM